MKRVTPVGGQLQQARRANPALARGAVTISRPVAGILTPISARTLQNRNPTAKGTAATARSVPVPHSSIVRVVSTPTPIPANSRFLVPYESSIPTSKAAFASRRSHPSPGATTRTSVLNGTLYRPTTSSYAAQGHSSRQRCVPTGPPRRLPLEIPKEKAVLGIDMQDGRWTCGKCGRANKQLRKVCGREKCGGIAPLNLRQVVLDCANVGCRYGDCHRISPPAGKAFDVERHRKFHWNGVREALTHYQSLGLVVSLVTKENWPAPIPRDLEKHACTVPRVDGDAENDDYFVLKLAYQKNCFYVTNDNFRNWKEEVEDPVMAIWFLATKRHLHVSYAFSSQGEFIPRRDAILDWADGDDSVAGSPRASGKAVAQKTLVPICEEGSQDYQQEDELLEIMLDKLEGDESDFPCASANSKGSVSDLRTRDQGLIPDEVDADNFVDELEIDGDSCDSELEMDGDFDEAPVSEKVAIVIDVDELELDENFSLFSPAVLIDDSKHVIAIGSDDDMSLDGENDLEFEEGDESTTVETPVVTRRTNGGFYGRRPWS